MKSIYVMTMWVTPSEESKLEKWAETTCYFSSLARAKEYIFDWLGDETNLDPILEALDANWVTAALGVDKGDALTQYWIAAYDKEGTRKGNIRIDIYQDEVDPNYL